MVNRGSTSTNYAVAQFLYPSPSRAGRHLRESSRVVQGEEKPGNDQGYRGDDVVGDGMILLCQLFRRFGRALARPTQWSRRQYLLRQTAGDRIHRRRNRAEMQSCSLPNQEFRFVG